MKQLMYILSSFILVMLLVAANFTEKPKALYDIPTQTLDLYKIINDDFKRSPQSYTIKGFQVSQQVTFKEYKEYLTSVKKDSSVSFYRTQLPDSSISSPEVYKKYISNQVYESFPVLGISWDNAMNFCKWKTIRDNKDSIQFVYRLPNCSEWIAAYYYLNYKKIDNDFNKNYSDWTINSKDESAYDFQNNKKLLPFHYDDLFFHRSKDQRVLKRKQVIGNSYLYEQENILRFQFSFYANAGYKQVSFRYIKEFVKQSSRIPHYNKSLAQILIEQWNLKSK